MNPAILHQYELMCSDAQSYLILHGLQSNRLLCLWNFSSKNTEVGYHFLQKGIFPTQGSNPHLLGFLNWQADSLPAEPQGKPKNTGVYSLSLLQEIFPTKGSNPCFPNCRWILYQLSYQGYAAIKYMQPNYKKHPCIHPFNYELEMTLFSLILSTFPTPPLYIFYLQRRPVS